MRVTEITAAQTAVLAEAAVAATPPIEAARAPMQLSTLQLAGVRAPEIAAKTLATCLTVFSMKDGDGSGVSEKEVLEDG